MHQKQRIKVAVQNLFRPYEQLFYYYFLTRCDFYDWSDKIPTMCATVVNMRLAVCYNNEFVDSLDDSELLFLLFHELFHHLHHHLDRGKFYDPGKANFAMDGIINYLIEKNLSKSTGGLPMAKAPVWSEAQVEKMIKDIKAIREIEPKVEKEIRALKGQMTGCSLDANYLKEGKPLAFEPYYEWLVENHEKSKEGKPNKLSPQSKTMMDNSEIEGMDVHVELDEVSQAIKEQIVAENVQKAKIDVNRNHSRESSSSIDEILNLLLTPPKKNNMKLLSRAISSLKGRVKEKSWTRMNRRVDGIKGKVGRSNQINAILDVSGSMSGTFDKVLREIFVDGYEVNLIQADTKVNKVEKIRNKNQLKTLGISGYGGTELSPAVRYVMDPKNKINRFPTVILTDGICDSIDFMSSQQQFLILTTEREIVASNAPRVRQIKIEA
jgi:predicted metal-dependent peptidase